MAAPMITALSAAHTEGVAHRNIRPSNLLLRRTSGNLFEVRLIDFGLTPRPTALAGAADYCAPEQLVKSSTPVGKTVDIFSFAKVCCFALFQTAKPLAQHWNMI